MKVLPLSALLLVGSTALGPFVRVFAAEPKSKPYIGASISSSENRLVLASTGDARLYPASSSTRWSRWQP